MSEQIESRVSVQSQVLSFVRQYPQMSLTGLSGSVTLIASAAHFGIYGIVIGGLGTYWVWKQGGKLQPVAASEVERIVESSPPAGRVDMLRSDRTLVERFKRLFDPNANGPYDPIPGVAKDEPMVVAEKTSDSDLKAAREKIVAPAPGAFEKEDAIVSRITIENIVSHVEPNSFKVYIGRSLTKQGNPPVQIGFYKQHFKFIGASQKGKSAMAAAFLDIVTQTHDPEHVLIALLDLEDQTSKLFADLPHVAEVTTDQGTYALCARSHEEVLHRLRLLMLVMDERYAMSKSQIMQEPILLVYVEEFLALKDYFKNRISGKSGDEKKQAEKDYSDLIFCVSEIARRGLKARVQLLLCAQVDYRDEDFQEALINVGAGMSFCVRPTAAQAAGFYNTELLARNVKEDKVGQAVVQMPDCKDLVLAPEYDLEQKLIALEESDMQWGAKKTDSILAPARKNAGTREDRDLRLGESGFEREFPTRNDRQKTKIVSSADEDCDLGFYPQENASNRPVDRAQEVQDSVKYRLDKVQTELFCVAYGLTGNMDESLKKAGAHTGYRAHARQIIAERSLKRGS